MLDIFSGLRLVVKRRSISIDNAIFRCHWFFTSTLLVSFSLVITARQYVGQPIECHSINKIPDSLLNSYCWVQSTFSVPQACNQQVGFEVPYPCIDNTRGREVKVFAYYQWVGMVLFIQGLLFHLPYYLWKVWENGLIKAITGGLRVAVLSDQEREKKKQIVVEYIHHHLGCHNRYAMKYFICEFICLINLLLQLWATNKFFDGQFLRYGLDVMQYSSNSMGLSSLSSPASAPTSSSSFSNHTLSTRSNILQQQQQQQQRQQKEQSQGPPSIDPMTYIFPRMTKCTYYDFGSSGDVQKHDALCLLPLNIINEKIYIALWFWFLVLALLTLLVIVYRLLAINSEEVRCKGLLSRCKLCKEIDIRIICRHCEVGDWFLFYMVAENLDPLVMREIVADIADKIRAHLELKRKPSSVCQGETGDDMERNPLHRGLRQSSMAADDGCPRCRYSSFSLDDPMGVAASSRRSSLADQVPLVKKIRKRLYSKRLWSVDLGPGEQRNQLFGSQQYQPSTNPNYEPGSSQSASGTVAVSAPAASELESAPAQVQNQARRGSLSRTTSTASTATADSFIMEMQNFPQPQQTHSKTVSTSVEDAVVASSSSSSSTEAIAPTVVGVVELCANRLERRLSSQGSGQRPPLLRQRNLHHASHHYHSNSIAFTRDLNRLDHSPAATDNFKPANRLNP